MSFSSSVAELIERSESRLVATSPLWPRVPLGQLVTILNGAPWKSEHFNDQRGVPLIRIRDVTTGTTNTLYSGPVDDAYWVEPGDILVGMDGDFNLRVWQSGRGLLNQRVCKITPDERYLLRGYLAHILPGYLKLINDETHSVTVKHLSSKTICEIPVPLPSLQEQRRVVAKLDSLRARSGRAHHELDHIPKLIERYKQAILAKAFSGGLTKEWREQHPTIGTGAEALAAIEAARISLLEGRAPTRRGPVSDGEAGRIPVELPVLPVTWEQSTLEMITSPVRLIQYGILKPGDDVPGGVPYVKVMNIQGGHIRLDKIRRTTAEIHAQYRRSAISTGDILLSIRGTVGRLAFVPPELDGGNITQDSVRIDVLPSMNARFVYWYLHSPAAQVYFAQNQKGVAVRGINVGDVRPMEIPIPPEAEQVRIVTLVEHALAWLEKIATEHARAERLLPKLDQAILAKGFRGELVPQDPNDEPASVLLERIKAERGGDDREPRRRVRG